MINDVVKDTEFKMRDILSRYHEIKNSIEIMKEQIKLLEELLYSEDFCLFESGKSSGRYNNNSVVENEVLHLEAIKEVAKKKKEEFRENISRLEQAIKIKKRIIDMIDRTLDSKELNRDQKFALIYCYIDKKYNNDNYNDIVDKFNQDKKYIYTKERFLQIRDKAISILSGQFISINFLLKDV